MQRNMANTATLQSFCGTPQKIHLFFIVLYLPMKMLIILLFATGIVDTAPDHAVS
jgi:hypothetical protein